MSNLNKGFTLVELMIVVAIIGIIGAVGYPMYTEQAEKIRRGDAISSITQESLSLEKCRSENGAYTNCTLSDANSDGGHYTIALEILDGGASYTLTATPKAGSPQANDEECTSFTLTSTGVKGFTGSAADASGCWKS